MTISYVTPNNTVGQARLVVQTNEESGQIEPYIELNDRLYNPFTFAYNHVNEQTTGHFFSIVYGAWQTFL